MRQITLFFGIIIILNGGVFANKNTPAYNSNTNFLSMRVSDAKELIKELEKKYNVYITYESKILKLLGKYDEKAVLNAPNLEKALELLTKNSNLIFKKIRDDFYVIIEDKTNKKDTIQSIKGTVLDENNEPLPGASVVIVGTQTGTITDIDGNFFLPITPEAKAFIVSFIGYNNFQDSIRNQKQFTIHLEPSFIGLDEVIVAGVAGKTSAKKLTVTVAKINADQLNEAPASSAVTSLQGKVAGVKITQPSGAPGSSADITLRGATSFTGNNAPLIMVDGNIFESSLSDINADDIKSMEIVKGAAAAALYGSKAGNGVIYITTYRGSELAEGKTLVKVRNEFGSSYLPNTVQLSESHPYELAEDAADYNTYTKYAGVRYDEDGNVSRGSRRLDEDHFADNPYGIIYDNQGKFYSPGYNYTNYVSVSNNSSKTNTFISFENNRQGGILFATNRYNRQNFRVNVDHRFNDKLRLSTSNLLINTKTDKPGSDNSFFDLLFINPDVNLEQLNEDSSLYKINPDPWSIEENPLYPLYYRERNETRTSLLSNVKLNYKPFDWFEIETKYSVEMQFKNWSTNTPRGYLYGGGTDILGSVYKEQYHSNNQTFQTTANFYKIFNQLTLKGKLSYLYEDQSWNDFSATGNNLVIADIYQLNNTDFTKADLNSYEGIIRAENIFGIIDVDYKDRYLFSALYRKDGSSLFGENERWQDYYRISGAYRISEDVHIQGMDELKIRAALGTAGQRPNFPDQYEIVPVDNGVAFKSQIGNKDLKPAESKELEIALDAYFLQRFNFQLSYSLTNTDDAILKASIAPHLEGYYTKVKNVGSIESKSLEATLGIKVIDNRDFHWNINITFDRVRQQITKLNVPPYKTGPLSAFYMREGETFGAIYGYKWLTSLTEMEAQLQSGQSIADFTLNSDGFVIPVGTEGTVNEIPVLWDKDANGVADLSKIGDGNPNFNMGLASTFSWKNLHFYTLFDWKNGGDIYNYTHQYTFRDGRAIEFDQAGKTDAEKKTIDYYQTFYYHTAVNSYFIEDGSYLKLRELSVFYDIPNKNLGKLKDYISSIRIGVVGHNLYTLTKYSGYDPEVASSTSSNLTKFPFDNFGYPNYRSFKASLEINF